VFIHGEASVERSQTHHGFLSGQETITAFDTGPMTLTSQQHNWIGAALFVHCPGGCSFLSAPRVVFLTVGPLWRWLDPETA
jgi:hypothetical protein